MRVRKANRKRSYLASRTPGTPTPEPEMQRMRIQALERQGVASIRIADIVDDWTRQAVLNEAGRQLGRRVREVGGRVRVG